MEAMKMEDRTNHGPTLKQNKWNSAFYAKSRCGRGANYTKHYEKWLNMKVKRSPF